MHIPFHYDKKVDQTEVLKDYLLQRPVWFDQIWCEIWWDNCLRSTKQRFNSLSVRGLSRLEYWMQANYVWETTKCCQRPCTGLMICVVTGPWPWPQPSKAASESQWKGITTRMQKSTSKLNQKKRLDLIENVWNWKNDLMTAAGQAWCQSSAKPQPHWTLKEKFIC